MVSTPQALDHESEPYTRGLGSELEQGRRFRILFADNDRDTRQTIQSYFLDSEFDIITVSSTHAARLIIYFDGESLDAIILDGRLTNDDEPLDRSGYELGEDLVAQLVNLPPIIIHSRYDDRRHEQNELIFISKFEKWRIVPLVREEIRRSVRRRRSGPWRASLPVVIFDDESGAAEQLRLELARHDIIALPCPDLSAMLEAAPYLPSAMFVIDLDAEEGARAERLDAVRRLCNLREESGHNFYVTVLAGHGDVIREAEQAGADVPLVKHSAEDDAQEISMVMAQQKMEVDRAAASARQRLLTERWYPRLVDQLNEVRKHPELGMATPAAIVERALNWPLLTPEEQLILTSLYTQMFACGAGAASDEVIDLCIEGASMLANNRAQGADVHEWVERATRRSPDFTLAWFKEQYLKETFDDDEEDEEA